MSSGQDDIGKWEGYQRLILQSLDDIKESVRDLKKRDDEVAKQITDIRVEVGRLKVKASLWGFIAGAAPTLISIIAKLT